MGLRTFGSQLKALVLKELFFHRSPGGVGSFFLGMLGSRYNYAADVGDGLLSSVVMPTAQFIMRAFPEAPLVVRRRQADELEIVEGHPLVQLVDRPNDFYPGTLLWMATILDWVLWGESYWRIILDRGGSPSELWWLLPGSCEPKWPQDGSVFISHYDYHPDNLTTIRLEREEVLHFRHGMDPRSPRHGLPPLRAILQDIWVDNESNTFVGAMLRNMGIPGMILSPKGDDHLSPEEVERVQAYIQSRFSGEHRGKVLAMGAPTDIQKLSFSPHELDLSTLRNAAEERVTAALGIPSAVIGFHSGLDTTKVGATMREYVRLAWNNGLVPVQRLLAGELQRVLLPYFEPDVDGFLVGWDYDEVESLQESRDDLAKRYQILVSTGILKVSEAREALGYESDPEDEIYLRPNNLTPTDPADQMPEPEPLPLALPTGTPPANGNASGNGNGNGSRNGVAQTRDFKQSLDEWLTGLIGRNVRRMDKPPAAVTRLANKLWRAQERIGQSFEASIRQALGKFGDAAGTAALEVLRPEKASAENVIRTAIISERIPFVQIRAELAQVYERLYEEMLDALVKALGEMGQAELTNPSRVQAQLRMLARERVGLLDLTTEARATILDTLEQATAAGLSEDAMIAAIKESVPRGRWLSVETRAQIITRTESRYAASIASAGYAREQGLNMLILDAQLGPSDQPCEERRGWIVSPTQATQLAASEHPNGTFQAIPIFNQALTSSNA